MMDREDALRALITGAAGTAMLTLDMRVAMAVAMSPSVPTVVGTVVFMAVLIVGSCMVRSCYRRMMDGAVYDARSMRPSVENRRYRWEEGRGRPSPTRGASRDEGRKDMRKGPTEATTVYVVAAAVGAILTVAFHGVATAQRGYEAVGGEFLFMLTPLWVWVVECLVDRR